VILCPAGGTPSQRRRIIPRSEPELEKVLSVRPDVAAARVIDYGPGDPIVVLVQPRQFCSGPELRDACATVLGETGARVTVALLTESPGGDDMYPDPSRALAHAYSVYSYEPPVTETETLLVGMWNDVLSRQRTGVLDDFLDLGGDSNSAVRLINRIGKELGVDVDLAEFFDAPSVRALAELIDWAQSQDA
jgi:aryl carrier-like protein